MTMLSILSALVSAHLRCSPPSDSRVMMYVRNLVDHSFQSESLPSKRAGTFNPRQCPPESALPLGYRLQLLGKSSSEQTLSAWPGVTVLPLFRSGSGLRYHVKMTTNDNLFSCAKLKEVNTSRSRSHIEFWPFSGRPLEDVRF